MSSVDIKRVTILKMLLEYAEKKDIVFVPEEFLMFMWYKYRRQGKYVRFSTVLRYLREFARAGLLERHYRTVDTAFGLTRTVVYVIRRLSIKNVLKSMGVEV